MRSKTKTIYSVAKTVTVISDFMANMCHMVLCRTPNIVRGLILNTASQGITLDKQRTGEHRDYRVLL